MVDRSQSIRLVLVAAMVGIVGGAVTGYLVPSTRKPQLHPPTRTTAEIRAAIDRNDSADDYGPVVAMERFNRWWYVVTLAKSGETPRKFLLADFYADPGRMVVVLEPGEQLSRGDVGASAVPYDAYKAVQP